MADPSSAPHGAIPSGIEVTFYKDGHMSVRGPHLVGSGIYTVKDKVLSFTIDHENGRALPKPATAKFTITGGGTALIGDSGIRKAGKVVPMRLMRVKATPPPANSGKSRHVHAP